MGDLLDNGAAGAAAAAAAAAAAMYRKIYRGDFKCLPWFSFEAHRFITKLLDRIPIPNTQITIAKVMERPWFKKLLPKMVQTKEEMELDSFNGEEETKAKGKQPETLNAFHTISLSEGFDLSPLFEEKKREEEALRFVMSKPASSVISKLQEIREVMNLKVKKSETRVKLQGQERGRKEKLAISADIFVAAPSFVVTEVKKNGGGMLEYNQFYSTNIHISAQKNMKNASKIGEELKLP